MFAVTGTIWFLYLVFFYTTYWSGLFKPYSPLLLLNEMLETFLYFMDPIAYIALSSELQRPVLELVGKSLPGTTTAAKQRRSTKDTPMLETNH